MHNFTNHFCMDLLNNFYVTSEAYNAYPRLCFFMIELIQTMFVSGAYSKPFIAL